MSSSDEKSDEKVVKSEQFVKSVEELSGKSVKSGEKSQMEPQVNFSAMPVALVLDSNAQNMSNNWKRWKRCFELFVSTMGISDDKRKKAMLLFYAGMDVQDIFYAQPDHDEVPSGKNEYEHAMSILDNYFTPQVNPFYERHVFRQIRQKPGENLDTFVTRLRQQAKLCEFGSKEDEAICDQIIESCASVELRKRLLEKKDLKLSDVLAAGRALESVTVQSLEMSGHGHGNAPVYATRKRFSLGKPVFQLENHFRIVQLQYVTVIVAVTLIT
jgi:hypothetical protein